MAVDHTISAFTITPSLDLFQQPTLQAENTTQFLPSISISGNVGPNLDIVAFSPPLTLVNVVPHIMSAADTGDGPTRPTTGIVYPIII